jgi:hypothetical protein
MADEAWRSPPAKEVLIAFLALSAVAAVVFGTYVIHGGFHLDDWADAAGTFYPPGGRTVGNVLSYFQAIFDYRPVLIVFTPVKYSLLGSDPSLHLAWTVLFGVLISLLAYGILRTVRVPRHHAWMIAALALVYPWFDSVRLWGSGNPPLLGIALAFAGLWVALVGVRRRSWRLHALAAALYLLSILAYEIALPLIAAAGALYLLLAGWRVAGWRWAVDLAVVAAGGAWVGTHTTRTVSSGLPGDLTHMREIVSGGKAILARTFDPLGPDPHTTFVLLLAVAVVAAGVIAYVRLGNSRAAEPGWGLREWLVLALGGLVVMVLGWLIFVPADPYYTPNTLGIGNRVNALAGYGLVILAYAVIGIAVAVLCAIWPAARRWAPAATVALAVLLGAAYVHVLDRHMGIWESAFESERTALERIERRYPDLPPGTTLFTSEYPAYQAPGVAVFGTAWDLNAAVKLEYDDGLIGAFPVLPGLEVECRRDGVGLRGEGAPPWTTPYGMAHLFNLTSGAQAEPRDRRQCEAVADRYVAGPLYLQDGY